MEIPECIKEKITLFTSVQKSAGISAPDLEFIYEVPLVFKKQGLDRLIAQHFCFEYKEVKSKWEDIVQTLKSAEREVKIALVGKYVSFQSLCVIHG